jgi:hypothetical protein
MLRGFVAMENEAVRALALGPVHGRVGPRNEGVRVVAVVGEDADANARGQAEHMLAHAAGSSQGRDQLVGDQDGIGRLRYLGEQYHELIATVTADRVRVADQ